MEYAIATLKKGEGRALKAGGAWIYDNEIESVMGHFEDGDLVLVRDFDGYGLGKGFINRHSKIRIRMMTRNPEQEIDREFIHNRVKEDRGHFQLPCDFRRGGLDSGYGGGQVF